MLRLLTWRASHALIFLQRKDGAEIEMECKTTSGDTGRQIHPT